LDNRPLLDAAGFATGELLQEHLARLPAHQPDFPKLLAEASVSEADARAFREAGVRKVVVFTEPWCIDSLHTLPLVARLAEKLPEAEFRVWLRDANIDFVNSIACTRPPVPYVLFLDDQLRLVGRFVERPESLTRWFNEQSRHFRTRLRMEQRDRVRAETWDGIVRSIAPVALSLGAELEGARASDERTLTVWEIWEKKPEATTEQLHDVIRRHLPRVSRVDGMLSVEFSRLRDAPDRYLALFRYRDEGYRAGFLASDAVREMRKELDQLWRRVSESTWSYEVVE
jgi:quinol monooxygenase YgiN/thiol-disulfide isomerase/thioredoxin